VPGLNPAIRGVTLRALHEGYEVIGIRHGWAGLVEMVRDKSYDNSENFLHLSEEIVEPGRADRWNVSTLFADESRARDQIERPRAFKGKFNAEKNDLDPGSFEESGMAGYHIH